MAFLNYYSVPHFAIWLLVGRYTRIGWGVFLALSIGWELLELVLPFEFAVETIDNKVGDVLVNCLGFAAGNRWQKAADGEWQLKPLDS
jgi:hypothetical protein